MRVGLAYSDARGRVFFDAAKTPLADGGIVRDVQPAELIPLPEGAVVSMLPGRSPVLGGGRSVPRRTAIGVLLPAGLALLGDRAWGKRPYVLTGKPRLTPPWLGSSQREVTALPRV